MGKFQDESEELQERINEILMDNKLSVIVEGEHDILAYEIFFDEDNCHIEQFEGKENAETVIAGVNKRDSSRAIAILDRDLDTINGKEFPDNVFLTDAHDIDTQMFFSDAFYRVAKEYYKRTETSPKQKMDEVRAMIIGFGRPLSYMRILSNEENYGFAFKASEKHPKVFPYRELLKLTKFEIRYLGDKKMVEVVCRYRNQGIKLDQAELIKKVQDISSRGYDDIVILHGHDLMSLMGLLIAHYGKRNSEVKNNDEVEQDFRLAYYGLFTKSTLYNTLLDYSKSIGVPFLRVQN